MHFVSRNGDDEREKKAKERRRRQLIAAAGAGTFAFVVAAWVLTWVLLTGQDDRGTWGDMFGGVNALFSGLALAGVVIAILLQSAELSLQRQELEDTREEIKGQRGEMELQNATLREQLYESSFLELLAQFRQVAGGVTWPISNEAPLIGAPAMRKAANLLERILVNSEEDENPVALAADAVDGLTGSNLKSAGYTGYLSFASEVLRAVDQAPHGHRRRYLRLFLAQMSTSEQVLVVFGAISEADKQLTKLAATLGIGTHLRLPQWVDDWARPALPSMFMPSDLGEGYLSALEPPGP